MSASPASSPRSVWQPAPARYAGHGGAEVTGWCFEPAGEGPFPGVLLVHEVFGLDGHVAELGGALARGGYLVLASDLWSRSGRPGPEPDGGAGPDPSEAWGLDTIRAAVAGLSDRQALGDLEAGLGWLAGRERVAADRLGVVGLCLGGNLAFQLACTSRRLVAAVDFYGRLVYPGLSPEHPIQPLELALNLSCPVLFHFGSEDRSIPPEHLERLERTLGPFMKDYELARWAGAGHGFLRRGAAGYHGPSAEAAWERSMQFLRRHLFEVEAD